MEKRAAGMTIIELMVTIAIGALLIGLAIPGLGFWVRESTITRGANDIVLAATQARSEAVKRRVPVTVCIADGEAATDGADGAECIARSVPAAGDAWMVFVDADRNLIADDEADILRVMEIPPAAVRVNLVPEPTGTDIPYLMFGLDGFRATDDGMGGLALTSMVLCDKRGNIAGGGGISAARAVLVSPTGRAAVTRGLSEIETIINSDDFGGSNACKP